MVDSSHLLQVLRRLDFFNEITAKRAVIVSFFLARYPATTAKKF